MRSDGDSLSKRQPLARRSFLTGAGIALALPFMPSLVRQGRAQVPAQPKRFIHVFSANGQRPQNWYPTAPQPWKVLAANGTNYAREAPLTGPDAISRILGSEFAPLKSKLLASLLGSGSSIDQTPTCKRSPGQSNRIAALSRLPSRVTRWF